MRPSRSFVLDAVECPLCLVYSRQEVLSGAGHGHALRILWRLGRTVAFTESFRLQLIDSSRGVLNEIERLKKQLNKIVMDRARDLRFTSYESLLSIMAAANSVDWRIAGYDYSPADILGRGTGRIVVFRKPLEAIAGMVKSSRLIYLGLDNAGEAVVDLLASAWLASRGHRVVVVARSEPYEVDITLHEVLKLAETLGIDEGLGIEFLGTGSMYPPLYRSALPGRVRSLLDKADVVIGKGIANLEASLESLDDHHAARTINLFRAKCLPLSRIAGAKGAPVITLTSDFLKTVVEG